MAAARQRIQDLRVGKWGGGYLRNKLLLQSRDIARCSLRRQALIPKHTLDGIEAVQT